MILRRIAAGTGSLLLAVSMAACGGGGSANDALPDITLPTLSLDAGATETQVSLRDLDGPLVVNLWASWCTPCRTEMPILQQFAEEYAGSVDVVGIDYQDPQLEQARALARETGVSYRLLRDEDGTLNGKAPFTRLRGLPFWAVVDAEGRVVHQEYVEVRSLGQLEAMVTEALGSDVLGSDVLGSDVGGSSPAGGSGTDSTPREEPSDE